jgi:hypothetical protein
MTQVYDGTKCGNGISDPDEAGGDSGCISNFIFLLFFSLYQIVPPFMVLLVLGVQALVALLLGATALESLISMGPPQTFALVCYALKCSHSLKQLVMLFFALAVNIITPPNVEAAPRWLEKPLTVVASVCFFQMIQD